jgi:hypothetical protein
MAFKIKDGLRIGTKDIFNNNGQIVETLEIDDNGSNFKLSLPLTTLTADRTITFPNANGTVALTSDLPIVNDGILSVAGGTMISGSGTFTANDSDNVSITLNHDNVTRTNNTSTAAPAHGGTFTAIDSITTSTTGHITAVNTKTITLPADNNTDTLQSISADATNNDRFITTVASASGAQTGYSHSNLKYNPSTETLKVTNLVISGTSTTVNTETINLADNLITLNSNYTGSTPTEDGGIEIERGTLSNVSLLWDESAARWTFTNNGTNFYNIPLPTEYDNYDYWTIQDGDTTSYTITSHDTLQIASGTYITSNFTADDILTISHNNTTRSDATSSASPTHGGTFTAVDSVTTNTTGHVTGINVKTVTLPQLPTEKTSKNIVGASNTATTNAIATNGNVYLNHLEDSTVTSAHKIIGAGGTTVTSDASGNITISSSTTESDTLATVTARGNVTSTTINMQNDAGITFSDTTAVDARIDGLNATIASTSQTAIDTFAIASYRSCKYVIQVTQGTNYQVSEIMVIHNGTSTYMTEYAVLETNGTLCNFTSQINGANAELVVTMGSSTSAIIKVQRTLITV